MGLFDKIRNAYRFIVGTRNNESLSVLEQAAVNLELQRRVYNADNKIEKAYDIRRKYGYLLDRYEEKGLWKSEDYSKKFVGQRVPYVEDTNIENKEFETALKRYVRAHYYDLSNQAKVAVYRGLKKQYYNLYGTDGGDEIIELTSKLNKRTRDKLEKIAPVKNSYESKLEELALAA